MNVKQKLYWLMQMGIETFCSERKNPKAQPVSSSTDLPLTAQSKQQVIHATSLDELNLIKQNFSLSSLKKTATHSLFGSGPLSPKLMCVLEMPDSTADREGASLCGAQIELLEKMMNAIDLKVAQEVYVAYFSPWRTPGNRALTQSEQALLLPLIEKEIQLVQPKKLLLFGAGVAKALLKTESLAKARGSWHQVQNIPTRVTLAISMLKSTPLRRQAWQDLQEVKKELTEQNTSVP